VADDWSDENRAYRLFNDISRPIRGASRAHLVTGSRVTNARSGFLAERGEGSCEAFAMRAKDTSKRLLML
jgi:hypothetical protein